MAFKLRRERAEFEPVDNLPGFSNPFRTSHITNGTDPGHLVELLGPSETTSSTGACPHGWLHCWPLVCLGRSAESKCCSTPDKPMIWPAYPGAEAHISFIGDATYPYQTYTPPGYPGVTRQEHNRRHKRSRTSGSPSSHF